MFSLSKAVPSIGIVSGIYQQTKLKGILYLLGLNEYYISKDMECISINDVSPIIDKLYERHIGIREKLKKEIHELKKKNKRIAKIITDSIK